MCGDGLGRLQERRGEVDAANAVYHDAVATAQLAVSFVRCRACGQSLVPRRRHWLVRLSPAFAALIGMGVVIPLLQPYMAPNEPPDMTVWQGLAVGVGLSAVALYTRLRERARAHAAADAIEWFRGEPPDKPFVGLACGVCGKKIKSTKKGERCPECGLATHERCATKHAFAAHGRKDPGAYRRLT